MRRARSLAAQLPQARASLAQRIAELLFDSAAEPLPAGVRNAGSTERRLLFQIVSTEGGSDHGQLDLRLRQEAGGTLQIMGQLLPPPPRTTITARLARTQRRTKLGERGDFLFRGLPGSAKALRLEIVDSELGPLEIPVIPLRTGPTPGNAAG